MFYIPYCLREKNACAIFTILVIFAADAVVQGNNDIDSSDRSEGRIIEVNKSITDSKRVNVLILHKFVVE